MKKSRMKSYRCIKVNPSPVQVFLVVAWLLLACFGGQVTGSSTGALNNIQCIPEERQALLNFNKGIKYDRCGLLASWTDQEHDEDCCQWYGIRCNNLTGHVIMLDLRMNHRCYLDIEGNISSLLDLKHLVYLDLSGHNFFLGPPIPSLIGSLDSLNYLNLSDASFCGEIPHQLANLSSLTSLGLSNNYGLYSKSLGWLSHMTLLRDIDLSGIDLSDATDWMHSVNNLPHLRVLRMDSCGLHPPILSSLSYANSTATLRALSLAGNPSIGSLIIFHWMFNLTRSNSHLEQLVLSGNHLGAFPLEGNISSLLDLKHLEYLDLICQNSFQWQPIPSFIGSFYNLKYLDLSYAGFCGEIPHQLANLSKLTSLDLSNNYGLYSKSLGWLSHMTLLQDIDLSGIDLSDATDWMHSVNNLPHLRVLRMDSSGLHPPILSSLSYANSTATLRALSLARNPSIGSLIIFHWMFNLTRSNSLLEQLDLSSNHLTGPIPLDFQNMISLSQLDLSNNKLEGPISNAIFTKMQGLSHLDLSWNSLYGSIPDGLALLPRLMSLNLSANQLSGIIPPLLGKLSPLQYIDFHNNSLSGPIPTQLEIFSSKYFEGNFLCGKHFFSSGCLQNEPGESGLTDTVDKHFYMGLYLSIALGFYVGFCGFFGTLALKDSWRHRYFQFLDHIINWVYVTVALQVVKFRRNRQNEPN